MTRSPPTGAPNAGGVGKIAFFGRSRSLWLGCLTSEKLCPSAKPPGWASTTGRWRRKEYAVSSTTLVVVQIWWSQLRSSWRQQGCLYGSLLMTSTVSHARCTTVATSGVSTREGRGTCPPDFRPRGTVMQKSPHFFDAQ